MIELDIPGRTQYRLAHLVLDVNGTLAVDGRLVGGVAERISALKGLLAVHLLTADTYGRQSEIDRLLDVQAVRLEKGDEAGQKGRFVRGLGAEGVAAVGNGANDAEMLKAAALGIAVLGGEGLAVETLLAADALAYGPLDALDLLLNPRRLVATLRR
jgi:soluble P-type ATPase